MNKVNISLRNRINSTCMVFLSMYSTHSLYFYRRCVYLHSVTAVQNEINEARTDTQTNKHNKRTKEKINNVTFLNLYIDMSNAGTGKCRFIVYICDTDHRAIQHEAHRSQLQLIYGRDKGIAYTTYITFWSLRRPLNMCCYFMNYSETEL